MLPIHRTMLGDLAHLVGIAERIAVDPGCRPDSFPDSEIPPHCLVTTETLAANPEELPDVIGAVPVLTSDPCPLEWVVAGAALLLDADVAELVPDSVDGEGRLDHDAWADLCASARDRAVELTEWASLPERLIDEIRDRQVQSALGYLRRTARTGQTVLIDGPVPAAIALILASAEPGVAAHLVPLQRGSSILEARVWSYLGVEPVLPWRTRIHDGSLARLALTAIFTARERV